jgi:hypothetical protein
MNYNKLQFVAHYCWYFSVAFSTLVAIAFQFQRPCTPREFGPTPRNIFTGFPMPGIHIFNRILPLANDDFLINGIVNLIIQLVITLITLLIMLDSCQAYDSYLVPQITISLIDAVISCMVIHVSLKGSVSDSKPRESISAFILAGHFFILVHIANQINGIVLIHSNQICRSQFFAVLAILVYVLLLFFLISAMLSAITYYSAKELHRETSHDHIHRHLTPLFLPTTYYNRESSKDILKEIALILTELFGESDLVVSDVIVGLLLVRKNHVYIEESTSEKVGNSKIKFGPAYEYQNQSEYITNLKVISYVSQYAEAMYGVPLRLYSKFGFYTLCCPKREIISAIDAIERTMDDGMSKLLCCLPGSWSTNTSDHPDLIYKSIKGRLFKSPFTISVDHRLNSIIISTRGTLSTTDLLVDLYIKEKEIKWFNGTEQQSCITHQGIYTVAENIYKEILANDIFQLIKTKYSTHSIICTGHSLGAAVSSLLAFLIKNEKQLVPNNNVIAICYGTPACIISKSGITYFESFCTSVVLGDDFITRLNPRNVHILKEKIIKEYNACVLRKSDLLASAVYNKIFTNSKRARRVRSDCFEYEIEEPNVEGTFLPGNILHFQRVDDGNMGTSETELLDDQETFRPFWVDPECFGREIVVSTSMAIDHMPHILGRVLRAMVPDQV